MKCHIVVYALVCAALAGCAAKDKDAEIARLQQQASAKDQQIAALRSAQNQPTAPIQSPPMVLTTRVPTPQSVSQPTQTSPPVMQTVKASASIDASKMPTSTDASAMPSAVEMKKVIDNYLRLTPEAIPSVVSAHGRIEWVQVVDIKRSDSVMYPYNVYWVVV